MTVVATSATPTTSMTWRIPSFTARSGIASRATPSTLSPARIGTATYSSFSPTVALMRVMLLASRLPASAAAISWREA
jgi:hypothetical protein